MCHKYPCGIALVYVESDHNDDDDDDDRDGDRPSSNDQTWALQNPDASNLKKPKAN